MSHPYIRAFDLGGGGLKTCLMYYNQNTIKFIDGKVQLGICPDDLEVSEWIRLQLYKCTGKHLDEEISVGYIFGFSLAGMNKLRHKPFDVDNIAVLFKLPDRRIRCIDDGAAHMIASLNDQNLQLPRGPIWNFALGTGVGFGFTDDKHNVRNMYDFWKFFNVAPWSIKDTRSQEEIWIAGSSKNGFDKIITDNNNIINDKVFMEYALCWKLFIEHEILDFCTKYPDKQWGQPKAIVFTGGHIETYGNRLVDMLKNLNIKVPVFTDCKNAGLLGAAWNVVLNLYTTVPLITAVYCQNIEDIKKLLYQVNIIDNLGNNALITAININHFKLIELLITSGADINGRDLMGQTPLSLAVKLDLVDIVLLLIDHGASVDINDDWDRSPMSFTSNSRIKNYFIKSSKDSNNY